MTPIDLSCLINAREVGEAVAWGALLSSVLWRSGWVVSLKNGSKLPDLLLLLYKYGHEGSFHGIWAGSVAAG